MDYRISKRYNEKSHKESTNFEKGNSKSIMQWNIPYITSSYKIDKDAKL